MRKRRCGSCSGCCLEDCGECKNCQDMVKFGGPGRKKRCCIRRTCLQLQPTMHHQNTEKVSIITATRNHFLLQNNRIRCADETKMITDTDCVRFKVSNTKLKA